LQQVGSGVGSDAVHLPELHFFDPLYDSVFGFFAQKDNPYAGAKTFDDLKGARICRPESYSLHDLEAVGLMEPVVTLP
jgi:ABC-type amino acid transport substrate-binding protein